MPIHRPLRRAPRSLAAPVVASPDMDIDSLLAATHRLQAQADHDGNEIRSHACGDLILALTKTSPARAVRLIVDLLEASSSLQLGEGDDEVEDEDEEDDEFGGCVNDEDDE